jgi:hypothetical protein
MGEKAIREIAAKLDETGIISDCHNTKQTAYLSSFDDSRESDVKLFSYADVCRDKLKYAQNFVKVGTGNQLSKRKTNNSNNWKIKTYCKSFIPSFK